MSAPTAPGVWHRFVALGDSLTEGLGSPLPDGRTRGWAAQLADRLREHTPDLMFENLAVRGYLLRHALERQLGPALDLRPDLVSVFIGGNDVLLRPVFSHVRFGDELNRLVRPLAESGATVVLSTLPDLTACSPVPPPYRWVLRRRLLAANAEIHRAAGLHETVLLDAWSDPRTRRHGMWSIDRIHPSAEGHRLIADSVAELLGLPAQPDGDGRRSGLSADLRRTAQEALWLVRHGARRPSPAA